MNDKMLLKVLYIYIFKEIYKYHSPRLKGLSPKM